VIFFTVVSATDQRGAGAQAAEKSRSSSPRRANRRLLGQIATNPQPGFRNVVEHDLNGWRTCFACKPMTLSCLLMANFLVEMNVF